MSHSQAGNFRNMKAAQQSRLPSHHFQPEPQSYTSFTQEVAIVARRSQRMKNKTNQHVEKNLKLQSKKLQIDCEEIILFFTISICTR